MVLQVPSMFHGRVHGSALSNEDQDNILHGMLRAAYDEAKGTGDGLDDGETNVRSALLPRRTISRFYIVVAVRGSDVLMLCLADENRRY